MMASEPELRSTRERSPLYGILVEVARTMDLMSEFPTLKTRVAGISFENKDGSSRQANARRVRKGDPLQLRREPENPYDAHAIAVEFVETGGTALQLGYVPRALASVLAPMVDAGATLEASVIRAGGGGLQLIGIRMKIDGDVSALPEAMRTGLEPAIALALTLPDDLGLAPTLGGAREPLMPAPAPQKERGGPPKRVTAPRPRGPVR